MQTQPLTVSPRPLRFPAMPWWLARLWALLTLGFGWSRAGVTESSEVVRTVAAETLNR